MFLPSVLNRMNVSLALLSEVQWLPRKRPSQRGKWRNDINILLYNPDNEVTNNFMPHLWMFLLKSLTPSEHQVFLLDGNARRMNEQQLVEYIRENQIGLVGIGAMTRMAAKAYRMADAVRAAGVPVGDGRSAYYRGAGRSPGARWRAFVTPTPSRSARPMKPGRESWLMPSAVR